MGTDRRPWACRECLNLRYASQDVAPADRWQQRADALYAKAGKSDDRGRTIKHKWMHWLFPSAILGIGAGLIFWRLRRASIN
jgi:hypothetical protein